MDTLPIENQIETPVENTQAPQEPVIYTGEMIANMTEEELEKHGAAIEAQFESMQSEEDYQKALQQITSEPEEQPKEEPNTGSTEGVPAEPSLEGQTDTTELSAEEFRDLLTKPFKASGREVVFKDPQDILRLMQQGFDYQKKMAGFKPQKRIIKTLEQHGLLDEAKLNQLIELSQGKPEAVAQFLKDRNIDTFELPDVEEKPHQYGNYMVNEQQVEFEEKVNELRGTQYGNAVLNFVNSLPDQDFTTVFNNQKILDDLTFHAQSGLLDDALNQLAADRAVGKVPRDMTPLDAYNAISGYLYQQNQAKYNPNQPRVVGNNLQTEPQQQRPVSPKATAGIPNNHEATQVQQRELSEAELQQLVATTPAEEISKYPSWEAFVRAQSQVKFR
nr:MAG TPA: hypothetical protein [Caudoviricetes sp.]